VFTRESELCMVCKLKYHNQLKDFSRTPAVTYTEKSLYLRNSARYTLGYFMSLIVSGIKTIK